MSPRLGIDRNGMPLLLLMALVVLWLLVRVRHARRRDLLYPIDRSLQAGIIGRRRGRARIQVRWERGGGREAGGIRRRTGGGRWVRGSNRARRRAARLIGRGRGLRISSLVWSAVVVAAAISTASTWSTKSAATAAAVEARARFNDGLQAGNLLVLLLHLIPLLGDHVVLLADHRVPLEDVRVSAVDLGLEAAHLLDQLVVAVDEARLAERMHLGQAGLDTDLIVLVGDDLVLLGQAGEEIGDLVPGGRVALAKALELHGQALNDGAGAFRCAGTALVTLGLELHDLVPVLVDLVLKSDALVFGLGVVVVQKVESLLPVHGLGLRVDLLPLQLLQLLLDAVGLLQVPGLLLQLVLESLDLAAQPLHYIGRGWLPEGVIGRDQLAAFAKPLGDGQGTAADADLGWVGVKKQGEPGEGTIGDGAEESQQEKHGNHRVGDLKVHRVVVLGDGLAEEGEGGDGGGDGDMVGLGHQVGREQSREEEVEVFVHLGRSYRLARW